MGFIPSVTEIDMLAYLVDNDYSIVLKSISIDELEMEFRSNPDTTNYSPGAIRAALEGLARQGFVAYGVKIGRKFTYYVYQNTPYEW